MDSPTLSRGGGMHSPTASEKTTSSRAVLAALRALQDKIARLEGERAEAVHATQELRSRLRDAEARLDGVGGASPAAGRGDELDELREAQHRLEREFAARDAAAAAAERRAAESDRLARSAAERAARAEEELAAARARPASDARKVRKLEKRLDEARAPDTRHAKKVRKLEAKLRTAERLLETVLQMNKLLVEGQAPPPPPRARPQRRARRAASVPPPPPRARSPLAKARRRAPRPPPPRDDGRPLPWVPSSDGGVSFNLAAACQYALRKTQHAAS